MTFQLAACAEMFWQDKPIHWRAARLHELGFGVGLWNWPAWDLDALEHTGAIFTIMNGYLEGRLADAEGADMLLKSARETAQIGKRLGVHRLNLHGTGLGDQGLPIQQMAHVAPCMWLRARDTLNRICDMAEEEDVTFTLENLNLREHPGCPFNSTADVLSLVAAVDRPQLRINLDLYHTQIGEGDVIRHAEACLPWIGEVQVAESGRVGGVVAEPLPPQSRTCPHQGIRLLAWRVRRSSAAVRDRCVDTQGERSVSACFPPPVPSMRRLASLRRVPMDTVPRPRRHCQGAATPGSASLGPVDSPSGTMRSREVRGVALALPGQMRACSGPGS